jgi:hypothetical protein
MVSGARLRAASASPSRLASLSLASVCFASNASIISAYPAWFGQIFTAHFCQAVRTYAFTVLSFRVRWCVSD